MEFGSRLALTFRENLCHFTKKRCVATLLRMHTRVRVVVALLSLSRDQCVFYERIWERFFACQKNFPWWWNPESNAIFSFKLQPAHILLSVFAKKETPQEPLCHAILNFQWLVVILRRWWWRRFVLCAFMHRTTEMKFTCRWNISWKMTTSLAKQVIVKRQEETFILWKHLEGKEH